MSKGQSTSGWFGKPKEERKADIGRHKSLKKAGENTARKHRDETYVHSQINSAIIEAEQELPWWRR